MIEIKNIIYTDEVIEIKIIGTGSTSLIIQALFFIFLEVLLFISLINLFRSLEITNFVVDTTFIVNIGLLLIFILIAIVSLSPIEDLLSVLLNRAKEQNMENIYLIFTDNKPRSVRKIVEEIEINDVSLAYSSHIGSRKVDEGSRYNIEIKQPAPLKILLENTISIGSNTLKFLVTYLEDDTQQRYHPRNLEIIIKGEII